MELTRWQAQMQFGRTSEFTPALLLVGEAYGNLTSDSKIAKGTQSVSDTLLCLPRLALKRIWSRGGSLQRTPERANWHEHEVIAGARMKPILATAGDAKCAQAR
jgi:hypothetical protein